MEVFGTLLASRAALPSATSTPLRFTAARVDNSVRYISPTMSGMQVRLHGAFGEGSTMNGRLLGGSVRNTGGP